MQVGEFQCYDKRALASLAEAASKAGRPEWGQTGPHDSGEYNSNPEVPRGPAVALSVGCAGIERETLGSNSSALPISVECTEVKSKASDSCLFPGDRLLLRLGRLLGHPLWPLLP